MGRGASLPCPACQSHDTRLVRRNRAAIRTPEGGIMRGHVCGACGLLFVSVQVVMPELTRPQRGAA